MTLEPVQAPYFWEQWRVAGQILASLVSLEQMHSVTDRTFMSPQISFVEAPNPV